MNTVKKTTLTAAALFVLLMAFLFVIPKAQIYADPPQNEETPPDSNVVLTDAFTTVSGADSYIHPVNQQQVVITENDSYQSGGIWYQYPIDLNYDFAFEIYIYLGNKDQDSNGGDGMTFTMHNDPRKTEAIGTYGGALGAYGASENQNLYIQNALSIEMDTHLNQAPSRDWDVSLDTLTHFAVITPASYETVIANGHANLQEVKDGSFLMDQWRSLNISWDAASQTLFYQFEGLDEQSYPINVQNQFGGTSVYWGFTGATGAAKNFQSVAITKLPQEPLTAHEKKVRNVTASEAAFAAATTADPGDIVEFQVTVENLTGSMMNLIDTVFMDTLDSSLTFIDGSFEVDSTTVTPTLTEHTLAADLGTILVGGQKKITFQCRVDGSGSDGVISNIAVVGSKYSAYLDSEAVLIYVQPDVSLTKAVDKTQTYTGDTLTYTITLKNKEKAGTWDGQITDQLAADLGNVSVSIDYTGYSGGTLSPSVSPANLLTIDHITLKDGEQLIITVKADIQTDNDLIGADYRIKNQASASGSGRDAFGSTGTKTVTGNQVETLLIQDQISFMISKELDRAALETQSFVFQIDYKKDSASPAAESFYGVVEIAAGDTTAAIRFPNMKPGLYTVIELTSRWRYQIDSSTPLIQSELISWKNGQSHSFHYQNNNTNRQWQAGEKQVVNQFVSLSD